jgi:hypothetical protein
VVEEGVEERVVQVHVTSILIVLQREVEEGVEEKVVQAHVYVITPLIYVALCGGYYWRWECCCEMRVLEQGVEERVV